MKPHIHSKNSARKHGGEPEDYQDIHDFIDSSKVAVPDMRHRTMLHNAWGCFLVETVFGKTRKNSAGKTYSPREIAEEHVIEDLGFIPTLERYLKHMTLEPWMGGAARKTTFIPID